MALLEVQHLKKYYPVKQGLLQRTTGYFHAVDDVSFTIDSGKTFGLVGESGCGKTTVGKSILRLIEPTGGSVLLEGKDMTTMDKRTLRTQRRDIQMIFQDPYSSLNPQMNVETIIGEPIREYGLASGKDVRRRVMEILELVGFHESDLEKYPHEFSGGQRQRIVIARALSVRPKLVVCDEPVSALDVSVQAQILNLMKKIQQEMNVAYLFIAHGMPVVKHISDTVGVMYLGKLVEVSGAGSIFSHAVHPYTKALMQAIPVPDPTVRTERKTIRGEIPSLLETPRGCLFAGRCEHCEKRCLNEAPLLREVGPGHMAACHLV